MGRLAGFKYRQIAKRLKQLGFTFDRQAADMVTEMVVVKHAFDARMRA